MMEVKELLRRKEAFEADLLLEISRRVREFNMISDVDISGITIYFTAVTEVSTRRQPRYHVADVKAHLAIE